ncbi:GNAT family N-acetyltransferase [Mycoplasmatota bacterium]|nr:GNAT family N-acetyltransferase [Mycoplasmatota bacterium]
MSLNIKKVQFEHLTSEALYGILNLRLEVFLVEQKIFYVDTDFVDQKCMHYYIEDKGRVVSYLRLIPPGVKCSEYSIGRVVTDHAYRNKGLSSRLINEALKDVIGNPVRIHGQAYLQDFYEHLGFVTEGEPFIEEEILHYDMLHKNQDNK